MDRTVMRMRRHVKMEFARANTKASELTVFPFGTTCTNIQLIFYDFDFHFTCVFTIAVNVHWFYLRSGKCRKKINIRDLIKEHKVIRYYL